jgi:hypothetical protein
MGQSLDLPRSLAPQAPDAKMRAITAAMTMNAARHKAVPPLAAMSVIPQQVKCTLRYSDRASGKKQTSYFK